MWEESAKTIVELEHRTYVQFVWKNLSVEPKHAQVRNCLYVRNMAEYMSRICLSVKKAKTKFKVEVSVVKNFFQIKPHGAFICTKKTDIRNLFFD